ncbi:MAG TPA: PTS sugar transporter subunit IIB [Ligilactobacillus acidipiscis]|uniref:PTS sugar transporter subunit IIB n=1 Tax=Ligilactobacillus acidipiscis TaxID=89059 RepID=A0A921F6T9_9LACO|nr:PTS sugar transporter subunit IIB [Ligilactobacillus acidipiscis]
MIKLMRIDYRLLHGQVAFAWSNFLGVNAILIANDEVAHSNFRKKTLSLAKPSGVKLIFKTVAESVQAINSGVTDKYKVFVIVETVKDAFELVKNTEQINDINVGLVASRAETQEIAKSIYVTEEEIKQLAEVEGHGVNVIVKQAPNDADVRFGSLVKDRG